jgi:hypothetical protein
MQFDQLKRRDFITLLGASAWPLAAWAQTSGRMRRIGSKAARPMRKSRFASARYAMA